MTLGWILFLYFTGCALILLEVFLPGIICGVIGTIMVVASAGLAIYEYPHYAIVILTLEFIGCAVTVFAGLAMLPRVPGARKLILSKSLDADSGYVSNESDQSLVGEDGVVVTALRPVGTISVGSKRVQAVANGDFIEEGEAIRVTEVHGNRIVVEKIRTA